MVLGAKKLGVVGRGQKIRHFFVSHGTRWPAQAPVSGQWAQAYHCGGTTAGLGLKGGGAGLTVRAACRIGQARDGAQAGGLS